jgi:tetratricopeptide (TPR) repeat protein
LLHQTGNLVEATAAYLELLGRSADRYFSSIDPGILGFKARQNLALVYADRGDLVRAEEQWRLITRDVPRYREGWRGLGEILLRQEKLGEVSTLAGTLRADDGLRAEGLMLLARLSALSGQAGEAKRLFQEASAARPNDPTILEAACRVLFDLGSAEVEGMLEALLRLRPGDAAARHNLGTVYSRQGRAEEAAAAYRRSVELRPNSAPTWLLLGHAENDCGRPREAAEAWREAVRLDPACMEAVNLLRSPRPATPRTRP